MSAMDLEDQFLISRPRDSGMRADENMYPEYNFSSMQPRILSMDVRSKVFRDVSSTQSQFTGITNTVPTTSGLPTIMQGKPDPFTPSRYQNSFMCDASMAECSPLALSKSSMNVFAIRNNNHHVLPEPMAVSPMPARTQLPPVRSPSQDAFTPLKEPTTADNAPVQLESLNKENIALLAQDVQRILAWEIPVHIVYLLLFILAFPVFPHQGICSRHACKLLCFCLCLHMLFSSDHIRTLVHAGGIRVPSRVIDSHPHPHQHPQHISLGNPAHSCHGTFLGISGLRVRANASHVPPARRGLVTHYGEPLTLF
jgi:hypothetical protein